MKANRPARRCGSLLAESENKAGRAAQRDDLLCAEDHTGNRKLVL